MVNKGFLHTWQWTALEPYKEILNIALWIYNLFCDNTWIEHIGSFRENTDANISPGKSRNIEIVVHFAYNARL